MKGVRERSEALLALYEQQSEVEEPVAQRLLAAEESRYAASQWGLMWRKFIRNQAAIVGGATILTFYLSALFADFLAPYNLEVRNVQYAYMPPQGVHLLNEGKLQPFVYGIVGARDPKTLKKIYKPDPGKKIPIRFFVKGERYKLAGLFPTDVHLFGVEEGVVSLLGTDGQG
ncbi:MAG: ABC transporter permease, partial [Chloroflexota bacterium]